MEFAEFLVEFCARKPGKEKEAFEVWDKLHPKAIPTQPMFPRESVSPSKPIGLSASSDTSVSITTNRGTTVKTVVSERVRLTYNESVVKSALERRGGEAPLGRENPDALHHDCTRLGDDPYQVVNNSLNSLAKKGVVLKVHGWVNMNNDQKVM